MGNIYFGSLGIKGVKGLKNSDPLLGKNDLGFYQLPFRSSAINASASSFLSMIPKTPEQQVDFSIDYDVTKRTRPKEMSKKDVGCWEFQAGQSMQPLATIKNTGPSYLRGL